MGNDPFLFFSIQTNRENLRIMSIFPELIANSSTSNFFLVNNEVSAQNFKKGIIFPQSFWILDSVKSREWCNMISKYFSSFFAARYYCGISRLDQLQCSR